MTNQDLNKKLTPIKIIQSFNNSISIEESQKMYDKFFNTYLNNEFFLNEKNKAVLKKIHEDFNYAFNILKPLLDYNVGFDFVWMGQSLTDFISGKCTSIKSLDIAITFEDNFTNFEHNKFSLLNDLTKILFENKKIFSNKILEKNIVANEHYPYLCEVIEFEGKNFSINFLSSLRPSSAVVLHYPFDILKVSLGIFNNKSNTTYNPKNGILFPKELQEYVSRLEYNERFIAPLLCKQLIYKNEGNSIKKIEHELMTYLPSLISNYNDFSLDLGATDSSTYSHTKNLVDKIILFSKLEKKNLTPIASDQKKIKPKI